MMSVENDFRLRLNEVSLFLRSLKDVEKRQLMNNAIFYRSSRALAVSRATTFIMIYNCVEYGTREALKQIKIEAAAKVEKFEQLTEYWKFDLIKSRFGIKLTTGVNFESFLKDISTAVPFSPTWLRNDRSLRALPFSGNINHEQLIDLARKLGAHKWRPPKSSLGGSDLELVRKMRNELAHGEESFENVGGQYSISDIADKLYRIRLFMCSYIKMLDRHRMREGYRLN